ncbi:dCTP deaminase [Catenulispora sp. GAS73]|uniref:dCTP deaminase n=1 Tax=Catenulispora sp. GAS73 TaxID=3156269 RepID=UPI003511EB06
MILTGPAIADAVACGDIVIDPFDPACLSPNAYDWHLGNELRIAAGPLDAARPSRFIERRIPPTGVVLQPGRLYLGTTAEHTASTRYAQLLNGDHGTGSLGVFVHVSAPLGHQGHAIRWTLEIRAAQPVRVYPGMCFGKLVFLNVCGELASYQQRGAKYAATVGAGTSRLFEEFS